MASSSPASETADSGLSPLSSARSSVAIGALLLSALYFVDTLLRATLKTFWYDELFTVYLCRLPTFHATWAAVLSGADLNPPLFYLITRWAQHWTGEGLISTRLPAIVGFWIFGACLYIFVARRLGRVYGSIAALAPWFTYAGYYAYEARPHGAVLAWCGLMMLCWQRTRGDARVRRWPPNLWVTGLFLSFFAALLTHVYAIFLAVPFLLAEADLLLHRRRTHLGTWVALLLPPCLVAPLYLRMSRIYSTGLPGGGLHVHPYEVVQHFLTTVFGPSMVLLIILLALVAWTNRGSNQAKTYSTSLTREERIVALGFLLLPVLGVVAAKLTHGPYFDRYFLDATAGYAIFLAQAAAFTSRPWIARVLLTLMLVFLTSDALIAAYCHWRHADLDQVGPGNLVVFGPDPARPFVRNNSLLLDHSDLDILVTGHPDYLFFQYYASPELRRRLIFAAPDQTESFLIGYRRLSHSTGIGLQTTSFADYFATHRDFLVYQANRGDCVPCTEKLLADGFTMRSVKMDTDGRLEHFSK
jgi:Dolichyl-phosphate-mannose-protein mannosyltransferase